MNVLLVDDDPIVRRATARLLPRFHVDTVGGVDEALSALEQSAYEAVIIDVCLERHHEDRSGVELVRRLRARGLPLAIVLVSGVLTDDLEDVAQRAGADAALLKADYDGPTLRAALERAMATRSEKSERRGELPTDLRALAEDVLDSFASERALEAEQAYRLALLAKAAFAHRSPRGSAIEACARAVGLSRQTLQPYAIVASRWSAPELKHLLAERRNSNGEPISISHLVVLAKLPRPARDIWLERVFADALTVRQLRDILKGAPRDG